MGESKKGKITGGDKENQVSESEQEDDEDEEEYVDLNVYEVPEEESKLSMT